jgi:hypothetical protein
MSDAGLDYISPISITNDYAPYITFGKTTADVKLTIIATYWLS